MTDGYIFARVVAIVANRMGIVLLEMVGDHSRSGMEGFAPGTRDSTAHRRRHVSVIPGRCRAWIMLFLAPLQS